MSGGNGLTVPTYQPSVAPQPMPSVRVSTEAPEGAFGGGAATEKLGAAVSNLGETVTSIAGEEKKKADQVAHLAADSKASDLEATLQAKVANMRGKDAFGAPEFIAQQWKEG